MREFESRFQEGLTKGLREEKTNPRNSQRLTEARNVKIGPAGLETFADVTQPFTLAMNWPYTQLARMEREFLAFDKTDVYKVNPADWSKSTLISGATAGLTWHYADYINYVILTNGSEIYERDVSTGVYSKNTSLPSFKTCCNANGQLIIGNVSDHYDCDSTFVAWSKIGEVNFEPGERQEAGYSPAWSGEIYNVMDHPKGFIAYGADGIRAFFFTSQPGFGQQQLAGFGIASRDAVASDGTGQLFLDDTGALWYIDGEFKTKRLGYQEFFSGMIGNDIIISYNPNPGEFYISDGNKSFVFYKGLSEVMQAISSAEFYNGEVFGVVSYIFPDAFLVETDTLDLGWRGFKRIETLEFGGDSDVQLYAAVAWRNNKSFQTSSWKRVNQHSIAFIGIQATEFRIKLKTDSDADVNLDYINIRFKLDDKRAVRGSYDLES